MDKHQFPSDGDIHDTYCQTHNKEYRALLHKFLKDAKSDKIKKLCSAADPDEKLFWKLLRHHSSSQMKFLVDGKLITEKNLVHKMWEDHFETLGTPSSNMNFDDNFLAHVTANVLNIFNSCIED